jgi:hypothetical protein
VGLCNQGGVLRTPIDGGCCVGSASWKTLVFDHKVGQGGGEDVLAYPCRRGGSRNAGVSPLIECRATRLCEQGGAAVAWPCVSLGGLGLSGE